jgi:hypothetical protein
MQAYSNTLSSTDSDFEKIKSLVEDIDTVILATDETRNVRFCIHQRTLVAQGLDPKTK